jgi:hypothetical protein
MGAACSMYGEEKRCIEDLAGNLSYRRQALGSQRRGLEDNIKIDV